MQGPPPAQWGKHSAHHHWLRIDEDASDDEYAEGKEDWHAVLWLAFVVRIPLLQLSIDDVHAFAANRCSEEETKTD